MQRRTFIQGVAASIFLNIRFLANAQPRKQRKVMHHSSDLVYDQSGAMGGQ